MSATVTLHHVTAGYGPQAVLVDVDLVVATGDRVGVVAPNGVGKSTLLRVLAGDLVPESGSVQRAPTTASVVRLEQEPGARPGETLRGQLARRTGVAAAQAAMDAAAADLATDVSGAGDAYAAALESWLALGGADLDERVAAVADELGLPLDQPDRWASALSGGQRARLALATVELARPDLLLLDEPTNDLDDTGLARLEQLVLASPAGIVVVSHDRAFLDRVVDRVVEIDEFTRQVAEYRGGWSAYLEERAAARRQAEQARDGYETERARLVDAARRHREWSRSGVARASNPRYASDGDKFVRFAKIQGAQGAAAGSARVDRAIQRLDADAPEVVRQPWRLQLSIAAAPRAGAIVLDLREAVVQRGDVRLGPFDLTIGWGERLRIAGPNGAGKTTLVDALLGRQPLVAGRRVAGPSVVFGELDQSRRLFDSTEPAAEVVRTAAGIESMAEVRTLLAKFRLAGDTAMRPATALSPGERTRAALAVLQARGVNCLVLDEPTNHLDLEAIEQLEAALGGYQGALVLVTHDRRLAAAVAVDRVLDVRSLVQPSDLPGSTTS